MLLCAECIQARCGSAGCRGRAWLLKLMPGSGWEAAGVEEVLEAPYPTQSSDLRLEGYTGWTDTEKNKRGRHIIRDAACDICGMEEESEFHGTVSCQHARSLRSAMREHWLLPEEKYLVHTGPEWLLHIVSLSEPDSAARLILTMWRAWFVRDRWTHEGKWQNESTSINFLLSYWDSLCCIRQEKVLDDKGKGIMHPMQRQLGSERPQPKKLWSAPQENWVKVNVDGALADSGV